VAWLDASTLAYEADGSILALRADGTGSREIYRARPGSGDPPAESVVASDDGKTVFFKSHDASGRASIWSVPSAGGRPRLLVQFTDPSLLEPARVRRARRPAVLHAGGPSGRHLAGGCGEAVGRQSGVV